MKLINYLYIFFLFANINFVEGQGKIVGKITNIEMAYPFWTPDATKIVFQSNWNGNWDIFIMDSDGSNIKQLTFKESNEITPTVSPNGMFISYVSDAIGSNQIYIMDIDGSNDKRITNNKAENIHPFWHPNENKIIFNSNRVTSSSFEIFEIDLNQRKTKRLTFNEISETFASWSPNGSKIAYVKWNDEGGNIFIMDYKSKEELQITNHKEFDGWPIWYGNDEIIFSSFRVEPAQIFKIEIENKTITQLTNSNEENARPNILENSLVYNGMRNGTMNIYVIKL